MITCYLRYVIDPSKVDEFEHYAKLWIPLVNQFGGQHHGYFLPSEGDRSLSDLGDRSEAVRDRGHFFDHLRRIVGLFTRCRHH